jgi:hypothetical protein
MTLSYISVGGLHYSSVGQVILNVSHFHVSVTAIVWIGGTTLQSVTAVVWIAGTTLQFRLLGDLDR